LETEKGRLESEKLQWTQVPEIVSLEHGQFMANSWWIYPIAMICLYLNGDFPLVDQVSHGHFTGGKYVH
jgi:hypothetical protein